MAVSYTHLISVKTTKLTARGLAYVLGMVGRKIRKAYRGRQVPHGKQSVRKLMAHGTATNSIELSGDAKSFDRVARKWHVDYAFDANASEQRIADTAALCKKYGLRCV